MFNTPFHLLKTKNINIIYKLKIIINFKIKPRILKIKKFYYDKNDKTNH